MEEIMKLSNIPEISSETKFWMIRAKRGFFFDEFLSNEFIAIGWNSIKYSKIKDGMSEEQEEVLKEEIKDEYGEKVPGAALNKCIKFCYELKVGDIAMIVDHHRVAFAMIEEYYEEENPLFTPDFERKVHKDIESARYGIDKFRCPYIKRRKIQVLKILNEDAVMNPYLYKALAVNRHSLSDLGDYAETILSGCFDSFIYDGKLTITFRIMQKSDISAIVLADFVSSAARIISNNQPEKVTVKTTLHSPGDVLLQIVDYAKENAVALTLCYIAIFGGKAGNYEFNSVISIIKDFIDRKFNAQKKQLELEKLQAEVDLAKGKAIAQELENIEKKRVIEKNMVDCYMPQLVNTASEMQVEISNSNVIDLTRILENCKKK